MWLALPNSNWEGNELQTSVVEPDRDENRAAMGETRLRFRLTLKRSLSKNDLPPELPNPNRGQFLLAHPALTADA
jgi:hypothetical protein